MAKSEVITGGGVLLFIAIVVYFLPINDHGHTAFQDDEICSSGGANQMAMTYGITNIIQECQLAKLITFGIYGLGLIGIILVAVGLVVSGKKD